jgi:hypothetical protein
MTNKYTASIDGVVIGKRTSKSREYTHCIAVKWCKAYSLKLAQDQCWMETDRKNYDYYMRELAANPEGLQWLRKEVKERVMAATDRDDWARSEMESRVANVHRTDKETDSYTGWHVITWCGRWDLAAKEYAKWSGRADVAQCRLLEANKL